jgi:G6PDH family F420-dependent oxidoreductase
MRAHDAAAHDASRLLAGRLALQMRTPSLAGTRLRGSARRTLGARHPGTGTVATMTDTPAASDLHIGYSLSCEEHRPTELVEWARRAEASGFEYASISDHFHPWLEAQGNSPFVWSVLGGIATATDRLKVGTGVTCPTGRYHPAIVAQAAATMASMMPGRFFLGVGTGENLNEHIIGDRWPRYAVRAAMLEEAVGIIRMLWTGGTHSFSGEYFTVENARIYTLPEEPPPIVVAASGPKSAALAGRIGDGLISAAPDASVVEGFAAEDDRGAPDRPRYLQVNVCYDEDETAARRMAREICGNVALQGELGNQLPMPAHYEQAIQGLTEDDVAQVILSSRDPEAHVAKIREGQAAGYDHMHVYQVGPNQDAFFRFYEREVLPRLR